MNAKPERLVHIRPAYDCIRVQPCVHGSERCSSGDPGGNHGIHNAELVMTVRGPEAEVTLRVGTGWFLPVTPGSTFNQKRYPNGYSVSFHTARPRYDGQEPREVAPQGHCKEWGQCYWDAGFPMAEEPAALLVEKGSDAVWEWLENQYNETVQEMNTLVPQQEGER